MPALIGGAACPPGLLERLEREFRAVFPELRVERRADSLLGAHAHQAASALYRDGPDRWIALDGEASLYAAHARFANALDAGLLPLPAPPFRTQADTLLLDCPGVGNVAVLDAHDLYLAADWTGSVPLYFGEVAGGLVFGSHLRLLARAIGAEVDTVGMLEFLRDGFTTGARTEYRGVRRLLGGQSLRWTREHGIRLTESSRAHAGDDPAYSAGRAAAEAAAAALAATLRDVPSATGSATLMVSGGWDSRTLLAVSASARPDLTLQCYSHGDLESRELRLTRRVCGRQGVAWHGEPLDDRLYDMAALRTAFDRTGTVLFPHWHRAARLADPASPLIAGVFGEMLGGRYWLAHTSSGIRKALLLFTTLARGRGGRELPAAEALAYANGVFRVDELRRPWYLRPDAFPDLPWLRDAINADVDACFARYADRGATTVNQLAEAFQADHTGSRYCNLQLLSCRAAVDVALPMANRRVLEVATRTPFPVRLNNSLNRRIIAGLEPGLLRYPMAATLVPAGAPIMIQEASRIARIGLQHARQALHEAAPRRVGRPRLSWPDYEFLASGTSLHAIIDELALDLWDRDALRAQLHAGHLRTTHDYLAMADRMNRILTLDMMVR